ncbi:hypothetical protein BLAT2472_10859 [Burkholderia latens]
MARLRERPARVRDRHRLAAGAGARGDRGREARSDRRRRLSPCADLRCARPDRADDPVPVQPERFRRRCARHATRLDAANLPDDRSRDRARRACAGGRSATRRGDRTQCVAARGGRPPRRARRAAAGSRAAGPLLGVYGQQYVGGTCARAGARSMAEEADAGRHALRDVRGSAHATRSRGAVRHCNGDGRAAVVETRFAGVALRARAARAQDRARRAEHLGVRRADVGAEAGRRDDRFGTEAAGRTLSVRVVVGAGREARREAALREGSFRAIAEVS